MWKVKFALLATLIGLSLTIVILFLQGGRSFYDPRRIIDSMPHNVDMQLSGINFTEILQGRREWTLKADTMHYLKKENLMVFRQVYAKFFPPDGMVEVSGDKGYYDRESQDVLLTGQVEAKDYRGRLLMTGELRYNLDTCLVSAPGRFRLSGPDMDLSGHGLRFDTKTNYLKVYGRPTVVLRAQQQIL